MNLGQIYTRPSVARYMASLFTLPAESRMLDPCFGHGAFIEALKGKGFSTIEGVEIDKGSYDACQALTDSGCQLRCADFFDIDKAERYDGIIMNPPYLRQEEIDSLSERYGISKCRLNAKTDSRLNGKANLYMYFIVYALKLLKIGGQIVVIFPNSWEKARTAAKFRQALSSMCHVEQHIAVTGNPFVGSPVVDVCILKLVKTATQESTIEKEIIVDGENISEKRHDSDMSIAFGNAVPLSWIAHVRRGKSTGCNKLFINPKVMSNQYLCEILSSPKDVNGFSTRHARTDKYLFISSPRTTLDAATTDYLRQCAERIAEQGEPKALCQMIRQKRHWYVTRSVETGNIVFPYIIRNSMRFILNDRHLMVRDNFYTIKSVTDSYLLMALLNNLYVWYQLERCGKTYGNNVLKIQKYDVADLMVISPEAISTEDTAMLATMGRRLAESSDERLTDDITAILQKYYNIENIKERFENARRKRLGK